jgi:hypothetical protein
MKKDRRALLDLAKGDVASLIIATHLMTQRRLDSIMATLKDVQDDLSQTQTALGSLITLADEDHDELLALKNGGGASAADLDTILTDSQTKRAAILADLSRNAPNVSVPTGGTSTGTPAAANPSTPTA